MPASELAHALRFHEFGEPESVLRWESLEPAPLQPNEVRLAIEAAPINPADINYVQGRYGVVPELPARPGIEGVGRVTESRHANWQENDRAIVAGPGTWGETLVENGDYLVSVPQALSREQAAMARVNPTTAWWMLQSIVECRPGDWIVQNAATSGVGRSVIQIAKSLGLRTINFQRGTHRISDLQALGADHVFEDTDEGAGQAAEALGGAKPTLALNAVGGSSLLRVANLLADGGTVVTYGAMAGQPNKLPNGLLIFRDLRFRGFWLSRFEQAQPRERIQSVQQELLAMMTAGKLQLPTERQFKFDQFADALALAKMGGTDGKILFVAS